MFRQLPPGNTLKLTFLHLKMDGWNTTFLWGRPIFRGYVSLRERTSQKINMKTEKGDPTIDFQWIC